MIIILPLLHGIFGIKLEDDFLRYFDESFETRQATDLYETELGGLNVLEYSVDTGIESGINSMINVFKKLEDLSDFLRAAS